MKKLLLSQHVLAVLFTLPAISVAGDSYDSTTGIVHMPIVSVEGNNYDVHMAHQRDLIFKVTSAVTTTITSATSDTFDSSTGILHMPFVGVGTDNFEVDMLHQGDLVFKLTSAVPVKAVIVDSQFPFIGRDVWDVWNEDGEIEVEQVQYEENGNINFGNNQGSYIIEDNYIKGTSNFGEGEFTFYLRLADNEVWSEEKCTRIVGGESKSNLSSEYFCPSQALADDLKANYPN